jgi:hypothetical protein
MVQLKQKSSGQRYLIMERETCPPHVPIEVPGGEAADYLLNAFIQLQILFLRAIPMNGTLFATRLHPTWKLRKRGRCVNSIMTTRSIRKLHKMADAFPFRQQYSIGKLHEGAEGKGWRGRRRGMQGTCSTTTALRLLNVITRVSRDKGNSFASRAIWKARHVPTQWLAPRVMQMRETYSAATWLDGLEHLNQHSMYIRYSETLVVIVPRCEGKLGIIEDCARNGM